MIRRTTLLGLLLVGSGCDPFTGDYIHVRRLEKSARTAIPVFEAPTAPYEAVVNPRTMADLASRFGANLLDPTCSAGITSAIQSCATHCSLDALDAALTASCGGIALSDGQADPGGPRFVRWLVDTTSDVVRAAGGVDPYVGYVDVDVSPVLSATVDYAHLDVDVARILTDAELPVAFVRRYREQGEILGEERGRVERVLALPEVRSIAVTELSVRTFTPDELAGTITDSLLLDETRYDPCVVGQDRFPALTSVEVSLARDLPPLLDGSVPSCDGGASCDGGIAGVRDTVLRLDRQANPAESCAIVVTGQPSANLLDYLAGPTHELELRIDLRTRLPIRPAIIEPCADGSGLACPRAASVKVGGYARLLVTLQNLDEHSLQRFIDAVQDVRDR